MTDRTINRGVVWMIVRPIVASGDRYPRTMQARAHLIVYNNVTSLLCSRLDENYEIADGVCIPRSTLYVHYMDYCVKNDSQAVNAASFGKVGSASV